jgi:hypothetical protein
MGKKLFLGITILLIITLFTGGYYFTREVKYLGTSAFRAVPVNAAVIIRIHHLSNYTAKSLTNPLWKTYAALPGVADLYHNLGHIDSLFNAFKIKDNPFTDKDLTVVYEGEGDHLRNLCMIELSGFTEKSALSDLLDTYFAAKSVSFAKMNSGGAELACYSWMEEGESHTWCYTFFRGLFLAGNDTKMIIRAIDQLESSSATGNPIFEKAGKTATGNIDLNIYLNHKKLPEFSRQLFSESFLKQLNGSAQLAEWSVIDLTQKTDELMVNGVSYPGDSLNSQLGIFLHQKPDSFNLSRIFPSGTTFFLAYVINNNEKFFRDYEDLLQKNQQLPAYKRSLNEISSACKTDLQKTVTENLAGAAAIVFTRPDPVMQNENKYLVLSVANGRKMESALQPLTKTPTSRGKRDATKESTTFKPDDDFSCKIYKSSVSDFGTRVFGEVFSGVETNYFAIYGNYLIMGASQESLERFIRANRSEQTLNKDQTFKQFTQGLSDRLNIYAWSSPGRALPFFKDFLNPAIYHTFEKKGAELKKIESVGWQIGVENGMTYNMARLKYNPDVKQNQVSVLWKNHLESRVISRPQYINGSSREIVLQDSASNFMLLNSEGQSQWKVKIKGQIKSEIYRLDGFKNGKPHYFFNTAGALHLIGSDGKYSSGFPLELRSPSTNGVAVFDYNNDKDYRFFIATKDHKINVYNKKGEIVTGWVPPKTLTSVLQPVQFFRVENKDYLVFADKNRVYLLDRKGKTIASVKGEINCSGNGFTLQPKAGKVKARLIASDTKGNVISIGFDGSVKKLSTGKFSPDHYFYFENFNSDNECDYLFFDGDSLVVYDQKAQPIGRRKFKHPVSLAPGLFTFPDKSLKIGIADTVDHKIYLFNKDGSSFEGFPLDGDSPFSIQFTGDESGSFNLITGTADRWLIDYMVK